jgi:prepilin-type N-terminal cleavage/methylation domain-containing protein
MTRRRIVRPRRGVGLPELLVGLVIMGIIGTAAVRTFVSQTRLADLQHKRLAARTVSRASLNLLLSDMRMVETGSGVAAASAAAGASSITLRIPIAMGIVCGTSAGTTVISMMPTDSVILATAALSGHAYRTAAGTYTYMEGAVTVGAGSVPTCTGAGITTVTGGRIISVTPTLPAAADAGTPVFLYQRVRYGFAPSAAFSGRVGLWRTLEATNVSEEVAAPFDTSSRFRFYRNTNDTSDVALPPLNEIMGIEFVSAGASETSRYGRSTPETAVLRTGVFFTNRNN